MTETWQPNEVEAMLPEQVYWLLENIETLRSGWWPEALDNSINIRCLGKSGGPAWFETPAGLAADLGMRLKKCGKNGCLVKLCLCHSEDEYLIADMWGITADNLRKRIESVVHYCSGRWPKKASYGSWLKNEWLPGYYA